VFLTEDAGGDLEDFDYINLKDFFGKMDHVLEQFEKA
jgi:hypothetical protein